MIIMIEFKTLEEYRENEVALFMEGYYEAKEKIKRLREEHGGYYIFLGEYTDITKKYRELAWQSEGDVLHQAKKIAYAHVSRLQGKVEKKIGEILEIAWLQGDNYVFKGTEGNCEVEVILAGGYNIQRLHTRWIIH